MDGDRITMSQRERDRLKVLAPVQEGRRTQLEAARLLGVTDRTVRRWLRRLAVEGDGGIVHRLRGRPSNRAKVSSLRTAVLQACRQDYPDFGPTLACEKLQQRGWAVGRETLRRWLLGAELWHPRRKRDKHRQRRRRRECFGELVQADGSHHEWLEGRGEKMVLLVMIDDATSKTVAWFYPGETTQGYMDLLGRYLRKHQRPVALYTDKHSVFWGESADGQRTLTQFTRALRELEIGWIPANSPQAKGRVERFNQTAQDRLVKELRLAGASTMAQANAVLEKVFLPWFNSRCRAKPTSPNNAHRPLHPSMHLKAILCHQEQRVVANDYTVRLANTIYQLPPPALPGLRGGKVTFEQRTDGTLHIRFKGQYLKYRLFPSADILGALPPDPRSLSQGRTPAAARKKAGRAAATAGPCAVRPAVRRSGRTPAEPCLPDDASNLPSQPSIRLRPGWAWRNFRLPGSRPKKRTILSGETTGQF